MTWPKAFSDMCQCATLVALVYFMSQCSARETEAQYGKPPTILERHQ